MTWQCTGRTNNRTLKHTITVSHFKTLFLAQVHANPQESTITIKGVKAEEDVLSTTITPFHLFYILLGKGREYWKVFQEPQHVCLWHLFCVCEELNPSVDFNHTENDNKIHTEGNNNCTHLFSCKTIIHIGCQQQKKY